MEPLCRPTRRSGTAPPGARGALPGALLVLVIAGACGPEVITTCAPADGITPVCGLHNPEDLAVAPGGRWLLASQLMPFTAEAGSGSLVAIRVADERVVPLFGGETGVGAGLGSRGAPDCPGPPDPATFEPHGLDLVASGPGEARLLVVNHGRREAVELFTVRVGPHGPGLTWDGCVPLPGDGMMNDVAALPDGGFVVTEFLSRAPGLETVLDLALARPTGGVRAWVPAAGWRDVRGTTDSLPNGIAVSPDGARLFVTSWGRQALVRYARDGSERAEVPLPMRADNLTWAPDGDLLVAGQKAPLSTLVACSTLEAGTCKVPFVVARVDPDTLATRIVLDHDPATVGGGASVALEHAGTLWLGTFAGDRVLRTAAAGASPD